MVFQKKITGFGKLSKVIFYYAQIHITIIKKCISLARRKCTL